MTTVNLSEYRNFKIQNDFGAIHEDEEDIEEEDKEGDDLRSQATNMERPDGRISCSYRSLAQHYRNQIGINSNSGVGSDQVKASDKSSQVAVKAS